MLVRAGFSNTRPLNDSLSTAIQESGAPRDDWSKAFPRFRAVRDGIQPR